MRFDLFWILDQHTRAGETSAGVISRVLEETSWAEALGFRGCWYTEHHFSPYGVCPSPPVLLAAAAARTRRVRLGAAVSVLPLNNPIRTAEDYAMVDVISGGRLDLGVGSGYLQHEYTGFGLPFEEKRQRFAQALSLLLSLWSGGAGPRDDGYFPGPAVSLNVQPLQRPHPPLWMAVVRAEAVRPVARQGLPIMLIPYAVNLHDRHLELIWEAYRRSYSGDRQPTPGLAAAYHAYVGRPDEDAQTAVLPYLRRYIETRVQHIGGSADDILRDELAIVGDAETCIRRIRRLERCGVTHLLLIMSFAAMPPDLVRASMARMAAEVVPALSHVGAPVGDAGSN